MKPITIISLKPLNLKNALVFALSLNLIAGATMVGAQNSQTVVNGFGGFSGGSTTTVVNGGQGSAGAAAGPGSAAPGTIVAPAGSPDLVKAGKTQLPSGDLFPGAIRVKELDDGTSGGHNPVSQIPNFEVPQTPQTIEKANQLEAEGEKYFAKHLNDKALASWQEAYGLSVEMKYAEGEGRALTDMCRIYLNRGDWIKAKYLGENAIEVLAGSSDGKSLGKARMVLAQAYFGQNNNIWAAAQLDEAIKLLTTDGDTAKEAGEALKLAGTLAQRAKHYKEAVQYYSSAANYFTQGNDQESAVQIHLSLVALLDELGLLRAALDEGDKAISIARSTGSKTLEATALAELANAQYDLGEFATARNTYEQALQLVQHVDLKDISDEARSNIDLGYGATLAATGDLDQARTVLERTLPALRTAGARHGEAQALNVLGVIEELQGNHLKAVQILGQALDLHSTLVPKEPRLNIAVLENLAAAQARSGSNRDAEMELDQAFQIAKKDKALLDQGRIRCSQAELTFKLADPAQSETLVHQAIDISEKLNDDASLWRDYTILAKIQLQKDDAAGAKESLSSALSYFRSPQAGSFPTCENLTFPTAREDLGQQLVALVAKVGMGEQALLAAEQLKDEAFSNEWHRRGGQVKQEDKDVYVELSTQRAHLHAAEVGGSPDKLVKDWQAWMGRFRTLSRQNRPLARLIAPVPNMVADVMRAVKASRGTVVEYLVGADSSVVFTLDNSGRITATVLPVTRKQLQSQVTSLLATSASPAQDAQRGKILLQNLYNELLPVSLRNFLPHNPDQVLAIIPDSVLFNLPFAALIDANGKYFIEGHTITLASSMGAFLDTPAKYADDASVILACARNITGSTETNMITKLFQPDQVTRLEGSSAQLNTLQEQARGKSVVHFGTNMPLSSNPMRSVLPLTPGKDDTSRSVTADRLFGLSIPSDLVVLSGTSVNAKDVQGDAVKVFSHGLNYAGARNLIMSLWVEPDPERTDELVEFYRNRQAGLTQAQSLRKAQMLALSRDPSPHSWAAFQLLGPGY